MAMGYNKSVFLGNVGKDIMVSDTQHGKVVRLSVATGGGYFDKEKQEFIEQTAWHPLTFTGKRAENAISILKPGSRVHIEAMGRNTQWLDNQTGEKRYGYEFRVASFICLDKKPEDQASQSQQPPVGFDDFDDDIPF